jgi:hypothetical protein
MLPVADCSCQHDGDTIYCSSFSFSAISQRRLAATGFSTRASPVAFHHRSLSASDRFKMVIRKRAASESSPSRTDSVMSGFSISARTPATMSDSRCVGSFCFIPDADTIPALNLVPIAHLRGARYERSGQLLCRPHDKQRPARWPDRKTGLVSGRAFSLWV